MTSRFSNFSFDSSSPRCGLSTFRSTLKSSGKLSLAVPEAFRWISFFGTHLHHQMELIKYHNRIKTFRILGTLAFVPSLLLLALFFLYTVTSITHANRFIPAVALSTALNFLSTAFLIIYTLAPAITSSPRWRLISALPTILGIGTSLASLVWMTTSHSLLPSKIAGTSISTSTAVLAGFGLLCAATILHFLFWVCLIYYPPSTLNTRSSSSNSSYSLPYHVSTKPNSANFPRPRIADIKIPPSAASLPGHKSIVITVQDPIKGSIIQQEIHTPKLPSPPRRSSTFSEHFHITMQLARTSSISTALPSPRRASAALPPSKIITTTAIPRPISSSAELAYDNFSNADSGTSLPRIEASPVDSFLTSTSSPSVYSTSSDNNSPLQQFNNSKSLANKARPSIRAPALPMSSPLSVQPTSQITEVNHFDTWGANSPTSPSTASIQRGVAEELKRVALEENTLSPVSPMTPTSPGPLNSLGGPGGLAARRGKKKVPDALKLEEKKGGEDRVPSPELPKTPKTPGQRFDQGRKSLLVGSAAYIRLREYNAV